MIYPTPSSRSEQPLYASGHSFIDKEYRGNALHNRLILGPFDSLLPKSGFPGCLVQRTCTTVAKLNPTAQITGILPEFLKYEKVCEYPVQKDVDLIAHETNFSCLEKENYQKVRDLH